MGKVLPILFNDEMVRAILDGRKTVTRRLIKHSVEAMLDSPYHKKHPETPDSQIIEKLCLPPCKSGDILYVRETWNYGYIETSDQPGNNDAWFEPLYGEPGSYIKALSSYYYRATDEEQYDLKSIGMKWRPSIHMPKEAARIWLRVTDVRVDKIKNISDNDAKQEGFHDRNEFISSFLKLYPTCTLDSYVWVISFEKIDKEF